MYLKIKEVGIYFLDKLQDINQVSQHVKFFWNFENEIGVKYLQKFYISNELSQDLHSLSDSFFYLQR